VARILAECPECRRLTFSIDTTDHSSPPGVAKYFCTECTTVWKTWRDERIEIVKRRVYGAVVPANPEPRMPRHL
jgi:hypothetical protein